MADKEQTVTVKVLQPIAQVVGPCLVFGQKAVFPKEIAEKFILNGDAELWVGVDLKEAVQAVVDAGGEISCDKSNKPLMDACAAVKKPEPEVESEPVDELSDLTVKELLEVAKNRDITIPKDSKKDEILALLKE